jgi:hypothetical protein
MELAVLELGQQGRRSMIEVVQASLVVWIPAEPVQESAPQAISIYGWNVLLDMDLEGVVARSSFFVAARKGVQAQQAWAYHLEDRLS